MGKDQEQGNVHQSSQQTDPVAATARVLAAHFPQRNTRGPMLCYCGQEWHHRRGVPVSASPMERGQEMVASARIPDRPDSPPAPPPPASGSRFPEEDGAIWATRAQARAAIDGLDRDAYSVVLGALAERVPGDVLAAVALWESIEASR